MTKKFVSGILVISMILGLVSVGNLSGNVQTVKAETGETAGTETRTVNLQTEGNIPGITNPVVPTNTTSAWSGSKVYFGKYANNPVLFRVLDANTTDYSADGTTKTMLLDSDALFPAMSFDKDQTDNSWKNSDVRTWVQGTGDNQFMRQFSATELEAIIESQKSQPSSADGLGFSGDTFGVLENDTVFVLDVTETRNSSYGYSNSDAAATNRIKQTIDGATLWWWTRSPLTSGSTDYVSFVHTNGKVGNSALTNTMGVSPAMNLDLSSILFTSVSGKAKASSFSSTQTSNSNTWNLTLAGGKGFTATLIDSAITLKEQIVLNVIDLGTDLDGNALVNDFYSQLSAMLVDESGTVVAYGKIGDIVTGTVSIELPDGVDKGAYTLKVFAEKVNSSASSNATDYASNMLSFAFNIIEETKDINLQVNGEILGIGDPTVPTDTTSAWSGSKVYFGKYANNPVLFRVLDANTTDYSADGTTKTMLLDSDALFPAMSFDKDQTDNSWKNSDVRTWVQGTGDNQFMRQFSATELEAIIESQKSQPSSADGLGFSGDTFGVLENDTVFVLDVTETRNSSYGYSNSDAAATNRIKQTIDGATLWWWTRSPLTSGSTDYVSFVHTNGKVGNSALTNTMGVSPAMNLDLSSILYVSASGLQPSSELVAIGNDNVANNTWKLTLLDSSKTVGVQENQGVLKDKNSTTVTVPYTYSGSDISQLSIMITSIERTSAASEVLYYGALTHVTSAEGSGIATFELPSGLPEGYRVYLLAEDVNEGNFTNYASEPVELGIVISEDRTTDFETFRDGETMEAPVAPSGYVFAGWYYDEACVSSPVSTSTETLEADTKVYAKFVPETVLSVKGQSRYTEGNTSKIDLRLVTTVDSFQYREVGFIVTNRAGTPKIYKQQYVFASLNAAGIKYAPEFFNACSIRFGTINISGITVSGEGIDPNRVIPVQAYWITKDGTRVTGPARTIKMSDAVASAEHAQATLSGTY